MYWLTFAVYCINLDFPIVMCPKITTYQCLVLKKKYKMFCLGYPSFLDLYPGCSIESRTITISFLVRGTESTPSVPHSHSSNHFLQPLLD